MLSNIQETMSRFFISVSLAQSGPPAQTLPNPLSCSDLNCALGKVIDFLTTIAVPILVIMVLWGGFQLMTAGGDEKKVTNGRHTLMWAVVGFAIVVIAKGVSGIIQSLL